MLYRYCGPLYIGTHRVYYMWRGCQRDSSAADGCVSNVHYEHCRETCSTDLCNGDDMSMFRTSTLRRQSATRNNNTAGSSAPNLCRSLDGDQYDSHTEQVSLSKSDLQ